MKQPKKRLSWKTRWWMRGFAPEDVIELLHLDCGECFSENVRPTGAIEADLYGAYAEVVCQEKHCGHRGFCGDGDFWLVHPQAAPIMWVLQWRGRWKSGRPRKQE